MEFKVIALPTGVAESVRNEMSAPKYHHPAYRSLATGYGPCRHCLGFFDKGKEYRILFTYDPFDGISDYALPGPIFIHADACVRYAEHNGFPQHLLEHPLTLQAYGDQRQLVNEVRIEGGPVETVLEQVLSKPEVKYVHVRDTNAGCYDLRVERSG
jgi:hypothetical protein